MVIADERVEPLDAARRLAAEFTARASEAEALRTMPPDLVTKVRAADLFRLGLPRDLGGLELEPLRYLEVIEECSRADGSAGWTVLIGNTTAFLAWLESAIAREFAGDTIAPAASAFPPKAAAIPNGRGGFTVSGRWSFNSGCPHADWFSNGVMVMDGPGPRMLPEGRPDWRFAFFPKDGVEIVDTWDALGLRGTGSHDTQVSGLRVTEELTAAPLFEPARHDGPLWRFAFFELLAIMMSGFPLGVARRALDEFATYAQTTIRPGTQEHLADDLLTQDRVREGRGNARFCAFLCLRHHRQCVGHRMWRRSPHSGAERQDLARDEGRDAIRDRCRRRSVDCRWCARRLRHSSVATLLPRHPHREPAPRVPPRLLSRLLADEIRDGLTGTRTRDREPGSRVPANREWRAFHTSPRVSA